MSGRIVLPRVGLLRFGLVCLNRFCAPVFFPRARERAAELDAEFSATGKLRGPLHGVPVSSASSLPDFKNSQLLRRLVLRINASILFFDTIPCAHLDLVDIEGVDSTIGFSQWSHKPAAQNADVRVLRPLYKTSFLTHSNVDCPQVTGSWSNTLRENQRPPDHVRIRVL
jgi:hypothetical protein